MQPSSTGQARAVRSDGNVIPIPQTGSAQGIHRTPPHSTEAEQGVLGSMLSAKSSRNASRKSRKNIFTVPAHQTIYNTLVDLWNAGQAIDLITFTQILRDRGLLDAIGGPSFITSL